MLNYHLIYTKPKCEDKAAFRLIEAGFDVMNPKLKERRYLHGRLQDAVGPLFPCYIFVRLDIPADYRLIKYTRGVRSIIGPEGVPSVVPDVIIGEIKERMKDGFITISPRRFSPGDEVMIKAGCLKGLGAVFEKELKAGDRVSILLKAVNVRAVVEAAALEGA